MHVELRGQFVDSVATLFGRSKVEAGPVCRPCGTARFRHLTDEALCSAGAALGFFGFVLYGWLFAMIRVLGNARFLSRINELGPPVRDPLVATYRTVPLDAGPTLWHRPGMARVRAFLVLVALVVLVGVGLLVIPHYMGQLRSAFD